MRRIDLLVSGLVLAALPAMAHAQEAPRAAAGQQAPAQDEEDAGASDEDLAIEEVTISGQVRGAVPGDIPPEVQLGPAEIRSYGVSNVNELIGQLSAQLGSGSGRGDEQPIVLLSGRRSSLREVGTLPVEAIERIDILPEEVALKYGYAANQKVLNVVLRPRFAGLTSEFEGRAPTAGGNAGGKVSQGVDIIRRNQRMSLTSLYERSSGILESERGVSRASATPFDTRGNITGLGGAEIDPALSAAAGTPVTVAGVPVAAASGPQTLGAYAAEANDPNITDIQPYRTLVAPTQRVQFDGVYSQPLSEKVRANATLQYQASRSESLQGLPGVTLRLPVGNPFSPFTRDVQLLRYASGDDALRRLSENQQLSGGLTLNGDGTPWASKWNWSVNAEYERRTAQTRTETGVDASLLQARLDARDPAVNPFASFSPGLVTLRPDNLNDTRNSRIQLEAFTSGPLFALPAGNVTLGLRAAGRFDDSQSEGVNFGLPRTSRISRDSGSVRGNIDVPITGRGVLDAVGKLSLNANFELEEVSDFGRLTAAGYGFTWSPVNRARAIVRWTRDSNAPSAEQLNAPILITPNVRTFDLVRGETVDITTITGGNAALRADDRKVFNARLNFGPFGKANLGINIAYTNQHFRNQTQRLPGISAEVEAAFPDRFVRDASGRLTSIDYRFVNIDRYDREELRWGFNLSKSIPSPSAERRRTEFTAFREAMAEARRTGAPLPPEMTARMQQFQRMGMQETLFAQNQRRGPGAPGGPGQRQGGQGQGAGQNQAQAPDQPRPDQGEGPNRGREGEGAPGAGPGGGGRFGGPGGGFGGGRGGFGGRGGGGGGGGNRIDFSLYHTWAFTDRLVIRPGLPVLDRLNGASAGGVGGGRAEHRIEAQGGISYEGYRLRLNGTWESGSRVDSGTLGSGGYLDFGSIAKVNLVAQVDFGQQFDLVMKHPWLRGSRLSLSVDNLFDARQRVTDQNGVTPAAYHPYLMDPMGRTVRLTYRAQFY